MTRRALINSNHRHGHESHPDDADDRTMRLTMAALALGLLLAAII